MKKWILGAGITICLAAFVLAILGNSIYDYAAVLNPANMLDYGSNYAVLQYKNDSDCPIGDTYALGGTCYENDSSQSFKGWAIIEYNTTVVNATMISAYVSNLNDGCDNSSDCGKYNYVKLFKTVNLNGEYTDWEYAGSLYVPYNSGGLQNVTVSGNVDAILVARGAGADSRPDPRVYWVETFN